MEKKSIIAEFKEFIARGNVMNLAVGVIIGAAFQNIVSSLTNSFINPLIALITGGVEHDEAGNPIFIGGKFTVNGVDFDYGSFISAVINFLIMAVILFLMVKAVNKAMSLGQKKEEPEPEPEKEPEPDPQQVLLAEIRDLLKENIERPAALTAAEVKEEK